jgi:hypothetical protein
MFTNSLGQKENVTPGGGGGSTGYFETFTPAGVAPSVTPTMASPSFQPNLTVDTR